MKQQNVRPLEFYTTAEIVDELKRRFPSFIFIGESGGDYTKSISGNRFWLLGALETAKVDVQYDHEH